MWQGQRVGIDATSHQRKILFLFLFASFVGSVRGKNQMTSPGGHPNSVNTCGLLLVNWEELVCYLI
jgi:hypothetical protein